MNNSGINGPEINAAGIKKISDCKKAMILSLQKKGGDLIINFSQIINK